jgi:hypothetical protein
LAKKAFIYSFLSRQERVSERIKQQSYPKTKVALSSPFQNIQIRRQEHLCFNLINCNNFGTKNDYKSKFDNLVKEAKEQKEEEMIKEQEETEYGDVEKEQETEGFDYQKTYQDAEKATFEEGQRLKGEFKTLGKGKTTMDFKDVVQELSEKAKKVKEFNYKEAFFSIPDKLKQLFTNLIKPLKPYLKITGRLIHKYITKPLEPYLPKLFKPKPRTEAEEEEDSLSEEPPTETEQKTTSEEDQTTAAPPKKKPRKPSILLQKLKTTTNSLQNALNSLKNTTTPYITSATSSFSNKFPKASLRLLNFKNSLMETYHETFPKSGRAEVQRKMKVKRKQAALQNRITQDQINAIQELIPEWKRTALVINNIEAEQSLWQSFGFNITQKVSQSEFSKKFKESQDYEKIQDFKEEFNEFKEGLKEEIAETHNPFVVGVKQAYVSFFFFWS